MPTYEYICENCGHEFEQFQSMKAGPLRKCPKCSKNKLKRLIGAGAGVIFKGSGFYETDYRSESYKKGEKSEKSGAEKKPAAGDKGSKPSEKKQAGYKKRKGSK
jgi:putative FmdB family regulatory protein